jgi:hypothetical protein
MTKDLEVLWQVHLADAQASGVEAEVAALDDGSRLNRLCERLEKDLEKLQRQLHDLQAEQRDVQLSLDAAEDKKKHFERELYQGLVSNPKELRDLEREIAALGGQADRLETRVLEMMEQGDRLKAEMAELERKVRVGRKRLAQVTQAYARNRAALEERLAAVKAQRAAAAAAVPPDLLSRYQAIRARAGGVGMARVERGACSMCNIMVPALSGHRARLDGSVLTCEGCQRLLYFGGEQDAQS